MLIAFDNATVDPRRQVGYEPSDADQLDPVGGGILQSIGLLHTASVLQLPLEQVQTGMFMQLVIGGHCYCFDASKGPFWKLPFRPRSCSGDHRTQLFAA